MTDPAEDDKIIAVKDGHIGRFILNNAARRNCVSLAMWRRMGDVFLDWADDPDIRVIVVSGAGDKAFCAGADIKEFDSVRTTPEQAAIYEDALDRAIAAVENVPKPTIARIDGACIGGGFELAILCDLRIASDRATFGVTPARLGLGYGMVSIRLMLRHMTATVAREILYTGRHFPAEDALRWGVVNRVVPAGDLDAAVAGYADEIAANAPLTLAAIKRSTAAVMAEAGAAARGEDTQALRDAAEAAIDACNVSDDYEEGKRAFAAKRKPVFKGK
jgi:enoyl-CoA hydratase